MKDSRLLKALRLIDSNDEIIKENFDMGASKFLSRIHKKIDVLEQKFNDDPETVIKANLFLEYTTNELFIRGFKTQKLGREYYLKMKQELRDEALKTILQ
jgi:hypothetical protein